LFQFACAILIFGNVFLTKTKQLHAVINNIRVLGVFIFILHGISELMYTNPTSCRQN